MYCIPASAGVCRPTTSASAKAILIKEPFYGLAQAGGLITDLRLKPEEIDKS